MKINSYILIFIGLLAVELIKNADAATKAERDLCVVFGDAAYQIALSRDAGVDIFEIRNRIIHSFEKQVREAVLLVAGMVYDKPWHPPATEAQLITAECIKQIENRVSL